MMKRLVVENFRCFHERQEVRMAPLTLLVGENSTGKTSFLALTRALWDVAFFYAVPDFKEEPYDLGSYDEIAHYRGGRSGRAPQFEAGFDWDDDFDFHVIFQQGKTAPIVAKRRLSHKEMWMEEQQNMSRLRTRDGEIREWKIPKNQYMFHDSEERDRLIPLGALCDRTIWESEEEDASGAKGFDIATHLLIRDFSWVREFEQIHIRAHARRCYAGAPIRFKPRRTYDPSSQRQDPEGEYIPMLLASMDFRGEKDWDRLKCAIEDYGKDAGLFDEFSIRHLGKKETDPFQLQVRKFGNKSKGPMRNLIDVGYGVSQVLPVIAELLRPGAPPMFLMQQPEVHLHPSAQAALGSQLCRIAGPKRQLVVETHSDYILDRVRMDIRDGKSKLNPEDVSILYFERKDLDVKIHSIELDEEGNVLNAPSSYRKFFMEEVNRRLKL